MRSGTAAPAMVRGRGAPSPRARVTRVSERSILLLKRSTTCSGARSSTASAAGLDSRTMACESAGPGSDIGLSSRSRAAARPSRPAARPRGAFTASAPVVQYEAGGVLVGFLLAALHPDHGEV